MQITVKNTEYKIEFTFEAAESDTIQKVFDYYTGAYQYRSMTSDKEPKDMNDQERAERLIALLDSGIKEASTIPTLTIDFLFLGLMEHHGINGDITQDIRTRDDARKLYKEFCKENPTDEKAMHTGLFDALKAQMDEDGFFKRIGLEQMLTRMNAETQEIAKEQNNGLKVVPQDHKKKQK